MLAVNKPSMVLSARDFLLNPSTVAANSLHQLVPVFMQLTLLVVGSMHGGLVLCCARPESKAEVVVTGENKRD